MVLSQDGITLAFLAERVEGVVSLELDALEPVLLTLSRTTASVLAGSSPTRTARSPFWTWTWCSVFARAAAGTPRWLTAIWVSAVCFQDADFLRCLPENSSWEDTGGFAKRLSRVVAAATWSSLLLAIAASSS